MRTVSVNLYNFNELSEKAKSKAIDESRYIFVDDQWWGCTYEDAKNIGLSIQGFDLDRNRHATGLFTDSALECANKITTEHGESTGTYALAKSFLAEKNEYDFDNECDDLEESFLKDLLEEYSVMLQKEYEYLTSDEYISEHLSANECEFDEYGNIQ